MDSPCLLTSPSSPVKNVSPISEISRNLTLRTLSDTSTPLMTSTLHGPDTPDSAGSFKLGCKSIGSDQSSFESDAEPSPYTRQSLHRRAVLSQTNRSTNQEMSPFGRPKPGKLQRKRSLSKRSAILDSSVGVETRDDEVSELRHGPTRSPSESLDSLPVSGEFTPEEEPKELTVAHSSSQGYVSEANGQDGFDLDDIQNLEGGNKENEQPQVDLGALMSAPMTHNPVKRAERRGPMARRCLSTNFSGSPNDTPVKSKRSEEDCDLECSKRTRLTPTALTVRQPNQLLPRHFSDTETAKRAVETNMDGGQKFVIPIVGFHKRSPTPLIAPQTLAEVIEGRYVKEVASVEIVDCRYPYEFEGGHIVGAKNVYTRKDLENTYFFNRSSDELESRINCSRNIVVFHCEFSAQRGPNMSGLLRELDRKYNDYPHLYYPQIFILEGGYKKFFSGFKNLCIPQCYQEMDDPKFSSMYRLYREESKKSERSSARI